MLMAFVAITQISHCANERLTRDAGVDKTVVSKIERGVTNPSLDVLLRLANHLDVLVGQLLSPHQRLN
jgi:transcriptional regulator with XRE-family HTH domain